jgi:hypothetical protein
MQKPVWTIDENYLNLKNLLVEGRDQEIQSIYKQKKGKLSLD